MRKEGGKERRKRSGKEARGAAPTFLSSPHSRSSCTSLGTGSGLSRLTARLSEDRAVCSRSRAARPLAAEIYCGSKCRTSVPIKAALAAS